MKAHRPPSGRSSAVKGRSRPSRRTKRPVGGLWAPNGVLNSGTLITVSITTIAWAVNTIANTQVGFVKSGDVAVILCLSAQCNDTHIVIVTNDGSVVEVDRNYCCAL